jgi:hypothetical protein
MTESVSRSILRVLASTKGQTLDQLYDAIPHRWSNTDARRPIHLLLPYLEQLMKWDLVEAFDAGEPVRQGIALTDFRSIRFYVSTTAAEIEEELGLNLTGNYRPIFGAPNRSGNYPSTFVLMPFESTLRPVFEDHITKVVTKLGMTIGRADDFFRTGSIINDIWSAIFNAQIVVADCTGRNPNVFYEIGMAHTVGRDTVLISQSLDDIPFDLRHLRTILYVFTPRGMESFEESLYRTLASLHVR